MSDRGERKKETSERREERDERDGKLYLYIKINLSWFKEIATLNR